MTTTMMMKVYKRTSHVVTIARRLHHGRQRNDFLEKDWQIQLSAEDIKPQREVALAAKAKEEAKRSDKLEKENEPLKQQVTLLADQVRKAESSGFQPG